MLSSCGQTVKNGSEKNGGSGKPESPQISLEEGLFIGGLHHVILSELVLPELVLFDFYQQCACN